MDKCGYRRSLPQQTLRLHQELSTYYLFEGHLGAESYNCHLQSASYSNYYMGLIYDKPRFRAYVNHGIRSGDVYKINNAQSSIKMIVVLKIFGSRSLRRSYKIGVKFKGNNKLSVKTVSFSNLKKYILNNQLILFKKAPIINLY